MQENKNQDPAKDGTHEQSNPKDRNFGQEQVSGTSKSTTGREQREEEAQDDYNAADRNFDHGSVSGDKDEDLDDE
jgi:hypothetical protein